MDKIKVAIVHFQPLEQYPPVMNMIHFLAAQENFRLRVYSTRKVEGDWFSSMQARIYRFGKQHRSPRVRYLAYLKFNLYTFLSLCIFRPSNVLYYETYSSLPVYLYKKVFPKANILIHFHEYVSPEEVASGSFYFRFLFQKEKRNVRLANWVSHTNEDRLSFFLKDFGITKNERHQILANYPPLSWNSKPKLSMDNPIPLKIVYLGSISLETMYFKEFAYWVEEQAGNVIWDIFSDRVDDDVLSFIDAMSPKFTTFKGGVNYFGAAKVLMNYHVGVILYKGHIKNFEFNAPNKLFEYLACGLTVWYPDVMIGCKPFKLMAGSSRVIETDFEALWKFNFNERKSGHGEMNKDVTFSYEREYQKILHFIS